jgi:hypothetical protein
MELLQRIQRWYTINCDGDWEYGYPISITTVSNPGWAVTIPLQDTCLRNASLDDFHEERSATNWVGYSIRDGSFQGNGGLENLTEILTYFLDTFLPAHIDPELIYNIRLPVRNYEGKLWLKAEANVISESMMRIASIANQSLPSSFDYDFINEPDFFSSLEVDLSELRTDYEISDLVEPRFLHAGDNTFLVAPAKE